MDNSKLAVETLKRSVT